ncbi:MAG: ArsR family transcriptional regulator [Acidimicrobiaceae bacterium]|nr:ArsR family transcriptional regulator [Acidimicrobiaceae bacterium]
MIEESVVDDGVVGAVALLKALASPVRLATMAQLSLGPRCVHEIQDALRSDGREVSQPLLSQHLKVLREAGLVTTTRRATEITYELADAHVGHIVNDAIRHSREEHIHDDTA